MRPIRRVISTVSVLGAAALLAGCVAVAEPGYDAYGYGYGYGYGTGYGPPQAYAPPPVYSYGPTIGLSFGTGYHRPPPHRHPWKHRHRGHYYR